MAIGAWQDLLKLTCLEDCPINVKTNKQIFYNDGINKIVIAEVIYFRSCLTVESSFVCRGYNLAFGIPKTT
jgi:hypothetical protein